MRSFQSISVKFPTKVGRLFWFKCQDGLSFDLITIIDIAQHFDNTTIAHINLEDACFRQRQSKTSASYSFR